MSSKSILLAVCILLTKFFTATAQEEKSLIDFFLPIEPQAPLVTGGVWGDTNVFPRDTTNGLEGKSIYDPKTWKYLVVITSYSIHYTKLYERDYANNDGS